jgi:hypothetical protein
MEATVWIGRKGLFNPFRSIEPGTLALDGERLTLGGSGKTVTAALSELKLAFPLAMMGGGFAMTVDGATTYVYFYDPFAGRNAFLRRPSLRRAQLRGGAAWLGGLRAARPWLKTLRAAAR